jgi:integrase
MGLYQWAKPFTTHERKCRSCCTESIGEDKEKILGHGFREMARTLLDEVLGFRVDIIEMQLAHSVRDVH